ncbi:rpsR [Cucurbita argyrosperma subsp. argyrosperma]|nr:rpsR [Cucurbita argyrosperma subsp. argyrosperma]
MRTVQVALRTLGGGLSRRFKQPSVLRNLSTNAARDSGFDDKGKPDSFESADDFERRIFGGVSTGDSGNDAFFEKLDRIGKPRERIGSRLSGGNNFQSLYGLDDNLNTLSDGMDGKLKKASTYFEFDTEEIAKDDYTFRADMSFKPGSTYEDLDLTKPGVRKPPKRVEFQVTTEEVLRKADFRNVRFLANFITDAGIIIKRSKTRISAKAQRKVAREIKTARAFGLMPFTTMGTKSFVFGKTMEDLDKDYEYEIFDNNDGERPLGS